MRLNHSLRRFAPWTVTEVYLPVIIDYRFCLRTVIEMSPVAAIGPEVPLLTHFEGEGKWPTIATLFSFGRGPNVSAVAVREYMKQYRLRPPDVRELLFILSQNLDFFLRYGVVAIDQSVDVPQLKCGYDLLCTQDDDAMPVLAAVEYEAQWEPETFLFAGLEYRHIAC